MPAPTPPAACASGTTPGTTCPGRRRPEQGLLNSQVNRRSGDQPRTRSQTHHPLDAEHGGGGVYVATSSRRRSSGICERTSSMASPPSSTTSRQPAVQRPRCWLTHPRRGSREAPRRAASALQRRYAAPAGLRRRHRKGSDSPATLKRNGTDATSLTPVSQLTSRCWCRDLRSAWHAWSNGNPDDSQGCHGYDGHRCRRASMTSPSPFTPLENKVGRVSPCFPLTLATLFWVWAPPGSVKTRLLRFWT